MTDIPTMHYFQIAGRGEISMLVVAAGGGSIKETFPGVDYAKKTYVPFGGLPVLQHEDMSICQSFAVERYLARIQPRYAGLTPQQRAVDNMFSAAKEDLMAPCGKLHRKAGTKEELEQIEKSLPEHFDRYLKPLHDRIPDAGFINGLDFPTMADLVVLMVAESTMPLGLTLQTKMKTYDLKARYPKIRALADRTMAAKGVSQYVPRSKTMKTPMNIPKMICITCGIKCCWCCCDCSTIQTVSVPQSVQAVLPPQQQLMDNQVELFYFPVAGRAELTRLIAAAGGVKLKDTDPGQEHKTSFPFFGSLPVLQHGSFQMAQSSAIETYVAEIAPKFKNLTPKQRGVDEMFAGTKEDLLQGCFKYMSADKSKVTKEIPKLLDSFLKPLEEKYIPTSGFVNGLPYPTVADLCLINIVEATVPFGAVMSSVDGGYNWAQKFPRIKGLVDRTRESAGVKEYLESTKTMKANMPA